MRPLTRKRSRNSVQRRGGTRSPPTSNSGSPKPLTSRANSDVPKATPIPQLRADIDACSKRLQDAIEQVLKAIEGTRLVQVNAGSYFKEGVETEEQLDNALSGLREECAKHVGEGKKVFPS